MDSAAIVNFLKENRLFNGLDEAFLEEAACSAVSLKLGKGERISSEETLQYFYVVVKGLVAFRIIDPETGRAVAPLVYEKGEGFDLLALVEEKEHPGEYSPARDTVTLIRVDNTLLRRWISAHPAFDENLLRAMAEDLIKMESFSKSVVFHDTKVRLLRLILKYARRVKKELDRTEARLENRFTHETLAELIGSVRTVVTTQLQTLKREGHLLDTGKSLVLHDLRRLKEAYNELLEEF